MNLIAIRSMNENDPLNISNAFANQGWHKPAELYEKYVNEQAAGLRASLVAETNGQFAGYVNIVWQSDYLYFKERCIPEIQDFNVLIKYRRLGIGTLLMDKAEEIVGKDSELAGIGVGLFSDYGAAQSMYVQRGYIPDGQGIYRNGEYLRYGQQTIVDDDLNLYFVKKL
ncbi:GNAT family N-acetyltransferase [Paenibacillus harenae]|uniref:GNAT superfamily N-acetyltransferase n=1 Tax=Paenibacillus harenae TaxID=306543 RepID=A0ABT9U6T6_PAEHA|nr:GNAT family N-acetyltransferase [Paenibacillus harenae]MDQ0115354.1 GNAT superfamily N-acetyltransferase [Paenibacillus harenae]